MNSTITDRYEWPTQSLKWSPVEIDSGAAPLHMQNAWSPKSPQEWFNTDDSALLGAMTLFVRSGGDEDSSVYKRCNNLSIFPNLKFLSIPLDATQYIDIAAVSTRLEHLHLTRPRSTELYTNYKNKTLPPLYAGVLPQLKTLQLICPPSGWPEFTVSQYPKLEWLHTELGEYDKSGKCLKMFKDHSSLQGFSLDSVKQPDLLKNLRTDVTALAFWSITTKQFDYTYLRNLQQLKYLRLRASFTPVDCALLAELPELEELELGICKVLTKTSALLKSKTLKKLWIKSNDSSDLDAKTISALQERLDYVEIE
jgi:hypothetical protein